MAERVTQAKQLGRERPDEARAINDRFAERATTLRVVSRVPMQCECGNPNCLAIILISIDAYREHRRDPLVFLTAPRHTIAGAKPTRREIDYWAQRQSKSQPTS